MSGRTYGTLRLDPAARQWVIEGLAPNVALRLKSTFPRVDRFETEAFRFPADDVHAHELLWFTGRYPLETSKLDATRLRKGSRSFLAGVAEMDRILTPGFVPPEYPGLKDGCALWPYQAQAVELFKRVRGMILGDEVGLGKTNTAIGCMLEPGCLPCAVVCQAHLPEQWAERIEGFSNLSVHVVRTVAPYPLPKADVYVFSYSKLVGWPDVVGTGFFRFAVFDEPQELRNGRATEKGKAAGKLCDNASARLGLTATPVMNYGVEMFRVMEFFSPGILGSEDDFLREWCTDDKIVRHPDALGAYLREMHVLLRRTEDDVGSQMPKPNVTTHQVAYDQSAADAAEDLAYSLAIKATTGSFAERGTAYRELDALTRQVTGVAKARSVAAYVRILLEAGLPVLLAGWHRECFAKGTPVLMADGRVRAVEDIGVGDRVMGPDSKPRTVRSLVRDSGRMFRVIPNKGSEWTCSAGHILVAKNVDKAGAVVRFTAEEYSRLTARQQKSHVLFRAEAVRFPEQTPCVEPWFIGYWLGDGAADLRDLRVCSEDAEVIAELSEVSKRNGLHLRDFASSGGATDGRTQARAYVLSSGPGGGKGRNSLLSHMQDLGLRGDKHIPEALKTASIEDRRELLAGLIDSDGHVHGGNARGTVEVTTISGRLASDIAFLARSLGFAAYVSEDFRVRGFATFPTTAYRVSISGDTHLLPMRIGRKRGEARAGQKNVLHTGFKVVETRQSDYYGFEVDGDHLFLLADFTVVHNCYDIWLEELKDFSPVMYTGSESKRQKRLAKEAFTSGRSLLMIISLRSGAGLDGLQHGCTDVVIGELDYSPAIHKQLIGRLRRTGQKDVVNAHYMIADGGSDPVLVEVLGLKSSQQHGIVDPYVAPAAVHSDEGRMKKLAQLVIDRRAAKAAGQALQAA